jgi:tetratricopeptide (TPR) repeat protein
MIYNTKKIKLIERYFNEELSKEELEFFEEEMIRDEKFKEDVQQFEFVFGGLKEARARKLKATFNQYEDEIQHGKIKQNKRRSLIMYSAGSVLVLFFIAFIFNFNSTDSNIQTEAIFTEYFKPYPNVLAPITRSSDVSSNTELGNAMSFYDSMQYDEAIIGFNDLITRSSLKNEMLFYKGIALLAKGEPSEARYHFELMEENSSFDNQRKWYLALTYIQLEEIDDSVELLREIIKDKSYFTVYAEELLVSLVPEKS